MENSKRTWVFWVVIYLIALVITLSSAVFQRLTGPNHPKRVEITLGSEQYKLKCIRSSTLDQVCRISFEMPDQAVEANIYYKRFPTKEEYTRVGMERNGDELSAILPDQPSAGKLAYYLEFMYNGERTTYQKDEPIIIRFNDAVPKSVLTPHIAFMFLAMFFANLMAILALSKRETYKLYLILAFVSFTIGGMILGPFVQKYAFGEFWTGFPNGMDLTDNKTLIAWLFMLVAVVLNLKKKRPVIAVVAAIVMLLIYLIPHSMFGSELDPTTGEIIQA